MEQEEEENGLFAIDLGYSDTESATEGTAATTKHPRDYQSEEDFLRVKQDWRARVEGLGSVKHLPFPAHNPRGSISQPLSQHPDIALTRNHGIVIPSAREPTACRSAVQAALPGAAACD
ncbi:hypothetical protein BP5796_02550 [Coleophoma crateriformis]|uniref:Uncharacterized protein n=1 Tax=Coleophoma crateriformis TaxID=565419 RepID=A0A3D8SYJ4_9HELO|nr:hypothetical protein BP5796_02550 [Coleophoma crateriformis]